MHPNPTEGLVNLSFKQAPAEFKIYNSLGELVIRQDLVERPLNQIELQLGNLEPGMYMVECDWKSNKEVKRLIVR